MLPHALRARTGSTCVNGGPHARPPLHSPKTLLKQARCLLLLCYRVESRP